VTAFARQIKQWTVRRSRHAGPLPAYVTNRQAYPHALWRETWGKMVMTSGVHEVALDGQ